MFVFKTHANDFKFLFQKNTCSIRTPTTNTNHKVCLAITHLVMNQFVSLFDKKKGVQTLTRLELALQTI